MMKLIYTIPRSINFKPFQPSPWSAGAHAQTVFGNKLRRKDGVTLQREKFDTPDGDFIALDYASPTNQPIDPFPADAPILLGLHGLEGSAASVYMLETYRRALPAGFRPVGMNFRTCGGEMNQTWRMYNAGATGDVDLVVEHLLKKFPNAPSISLIGFSLGGNILAKYLGEGRVLSGKVQSAAIVSPPFDMNLGIQNLLHGMGWLYGYRFLRTLKAKTKLKEELVKDRVDVAACYAAKTLLEFDDVGTSQLYGYKNAADYYTQCGCHQFLDGINIPTLLIRSLDDPFMDPADIPYHTIQANPNLFAAITEKGGHVGFMTKGRRFWAEDLAVKFVNTMMK
ncbi:MAG: YheT family hydrolase [Anaerolineae bacterium]